MIHQDFKQLKEKTQKRLKTVPEGAYEFELRLQVLAMQLLVNGEPVTPDKLSEVWEIPLEQVNMVFEQAKAQGTLEVDRDGNMVGAAISLIPTSHSFQINGHTLYAWCAYDTVFAAGIIDKHAIIDTVDPYSKAPIHIAISPDRIIENSPKTIVATYVGMEADMRGGANSQRCSQMHFFETEENAKIWSSNYKDVTILTMGQLIELVEEFQVEPARRMGLLTKVKK